VKNLSNTMALAMSGENNLALKANGTVWNWNQYGQSAQVPAPEA
jgi:hypothetical protein